jgi:small-conductance mechanosensitive channel
MSILPIRWTNSFGLRLLIILSLAYLLNPSWVYAAPDNNTAITPAQAQRAAEVLKDPVKRREAETTLKAISDAAPADVSADSGGASATTGTPASPVQESADASNAPPAKTVTAPLEKNGLIAQLLRQIDRWSDQLGRQLHQTAAGLLGVPALLDQLGNGFADPAQQALLRSAGIAVLLVLGIAFAIEWAMHYVLRPAKKSLFRHAHSATAQAAHKAAQDDAHLKEQVRIDSVSASNGAADETLSGMRTAEGDVALVRSERNGIDHVVAVPVGPQMAAGPGASDNADEAKLASAQTKNEIEPKPSSGWHSARFRQLPYSICLLLLDLLPLACFLVVAAILSHYVDATDDRISAVVRSFIDAYISVRVVMSILRLLAAPKDRGLPLLKLRDAISVPLYRWSQRIVVVAAFGIAIAEAVEILGADPTERLAIVKIVSLIVHCFMLILIIRVRLPVGAMIEPKEGSQGLIASLRHWLARSWAYVAGILVIGVWLVWAMGVEDGFPKLIRFFVASIAVIIGAHVVSILLSGALNRAAERNATKEGDTAAESAVHLQRYYALAHRIVSILVTVVACVTLLEVWGVNVIAWLSGSAIGRSFLSAFLTIAVAVLIAIVIWEAANASVKKRLDHWKEQGELVRAARLRTLVPMMKTILFIVILLVVGLTALSQIGVNTTPLLASASIIGVAVGFGSQKLVQDFITGIFLLMENAMQVGDWVTVAGVSGTVEYLSIRTVRLRAGDGSLHIVPFSSVSTVNNTNRGLGNAAMRVSVSFGTDVDKAINELKQIGAGLRADPAFQAQILGDIEVWGVDAVDGSTVTLAGQIRCTDTGRWGVQRELNRRILERFRELGIQISDPRTTLLLPGETVPPLTSAAQKPVGN